MVVDTETDTYYDVFTATSGLINSPNYPQPYPSNVMKYYVIQAPSSATIKLQFLDFDVFASEYDGWGDYLWVRVKFLYIYI